MRTMRGIWAGWIAALVLLLPTGGWALGLGVYVEGAGGDLDWTVEDDFGHEFDVDADGSKAAFGFVLDTAVAQDTVFHYRLNFGLARFDADFDNGGDTLEMGGLVADNTFGFAVLRRDTLRLWLGPQVRLAYYAGEFEDSNLEVDVVEFALAPVAGLNLHFGRLVTLALTGGYRFSGYAGSDEDDNEIRGTGREVFGTLAVLFRLQGDSYR